MSSPPKILHIISSWESGVGNELAEFAARLSRSEFESEICVLAGSNRRSVPAVPATTPITTLGLRWTCDVSTYLGVRRVLRRFRPDVVHAWDDVAHSYAALHSGTQRILAEKRETDAPQGLPKGLPRGLLQGLLQKHIDRKTDRFIVPRQNNAALDGTVPTVKTPTAKTVVIPPAAVPVQSSVQPSERMSAEKLLEKLDIPLVESSGDYYPVFEPQYEPAQRNYKSMPPHQTPFLVGIILPLCLEHRILDALWAFETLNHVHLNYHAFFIGDGKDRETFLRYRDRWKLFSRVHFLGEQDLREQHLGNRSISERLLPHFDVLLHLSPSAEHSGTILSAMSCGVPVIALETPESREYITDGTTGILIPAEGDFRFYRRTAVKKLLYLLEKEELRRSMQIAGKDRITKEYNFDAAVQRRIALYRELAYRESTDGRTSSRH